MVVATPLPPRRLAKLWGRGAGDGLPGASLVCLTSSQGWGVVVRITLACLAPCLTFTFMPYYPFWSLPIIALVDDVRK